MQKIILASTSARRKEILSWLNIPFETASPDVDEETIRDPHAEKLSQLLAEAKAENIAQHFSDGLIIGSDIVGECNGEIIEKPKDKEDQRRMIDLFQQFPTNWYTGVCIIDASTKHKVLRFDKSTLYMPKLDPERLDTYIESEIGLGKGGGIGIQDENGMFIEKIDGSYTNIVGFPISLVAEMLQEFGVHIPVNVREVTKVHTRYDS